MISKGTGYYALRYSLSGLVIQLVCSGYTVCLGHKHNQAGAAIQSVWGVSTIRLGCLYSQAGAICTIKLGRLYSLSVLAVQFDCNYNTKKMAYMNQTLKNKKVRFQKTRNGLVTLGGLEPSTLCLEGRCSNPAELKRRMENSLYYFAHFFKCKI